MAAGQGHLPLEALPPLITIARRFERVSDQATNICEEALYFATGEYLRHLPREGFRVLFVDETNGCLSRMAEAIGNGLGAKRFSFASAGIDGRPRRSADGPVPRGEGDRHLAASRRGRWSEVPQLDQVQVIVALCKEAERTIPQRPPKTVGPGLVRAGSLAGAGHPGGGAGRVRTTYETLTSHIRDLVQAILGNDERQANEQATHPSDICGVRRAAVVAARRGCARVAAGRRARGPREPEKTVIQNTGSDTMVNLAQAWAEEYAQVDPAVSVEVSGGGSGTGIAALDQRHRGHRQLQPPDRAAGDRRRPRRTPARSRGSSWSGYDALAVYVHKDNPLEEITLEQLAEIYGEGGKITTWSQLGVTMPAGADEIIRVSRQTNSGTYAYFREAVLGKGRDFKLGSLDMNGSKDVVELVSQDARRHRLQRHGLRHAGREDAARRQEGGRPGRARRRSRTR